MQSEKFSRYEIRAELGRGGMATVYRAYDPLFEREVALKLLNRELLDNSQFRERFERETKIIARLEHPAIVPVYDVGRDNAQMFYVMRYMVGGCLSDRMKEGPLSLAETISIIQRIAAGLDYAHAKGVIHRDLKPGNILFDENGNAFISDFGIAKLTHGQTRLTSSGIIGTPAYMSPEQAQGEELDGRSDIYSLGIILFEMLSGKVPYEATTPLAMVIKHLNEPIPHILDINPHLPTSIEMILEKTLAKNRNLRYASAMEMANALVATLDEVSSAPEYKKTIFPGAHHTATAPIRGTVTTREKLKRAWIFGGVAMLSIAVLGIWGGSQLWAAPAPTPTPLSLPSATTNLSTPTELPPDTAVPPTPTPEPSPTPTTLPVLGLGGADKIALLTNNDIWMLDVDGSNLMQLTNSDQNKFDLQWLPGGQELIYGEGKCVNTVNVDSQEVTKLTCFESPYFESFRVSPDGKQAAVTIERRVVIVPFDREKLAAATTTFDLQNLDACLDYSDVSAKSAHWSADGKKLAVLYQSVKGQRLADTIRILNISRCKTADALILDEFPAKRFTPEGYETYPILPAYSWDGEQRFLFNTFKRNLGYGALYLYDTATRQARKLNPVNNVCCYRDASFSPDGQYILLVFQDERLGAESETLLYYLPVDQINTGATFDPLLLPPLFFPDPRAEIQPVLRQSTP